MWMREVPLAPRTRWRIGGPAVALGEASTESELGELLAGAEGRRIQVLGGGANLLVSDDGIDAAVVVLTGEFRGLSVLERSLEFGGAETIASVVQAARRHGRSGLWILEAVPGTMGGALRMNAGTATEGLWKRMLWAEVMYPDRRTVRVASEDVSPSYRRIDLAPEAIFLRGAVGAPPGEAERIEEEHMRRRREKLEAQVYDQPSCGSIWKNPGPSSPSAWELVERVGMRGARRGGARISAKHANFIVNMGDARACDVVELMLETRRRVYEEAGVELEPEIVFWGFPADLLRELGALE